MRIDHHTDSTWRFPLRRLSQVNNLRREKRSYTFCSRLQHDSWFTVPHTDCWLRLLTYFSRQWKAKFGNGNCAAGCNLRANESTILSVVNVCRLPSSSRRSFPLKRDRKGKKRQKEFLMPSFSLISYPSLLSALMYSFFSLRLSLHACCDDYTVSRTEHSVLSRTGISLLSPPNFRSSLSFVFFAPFEYPSNGGPENRLIKGQHFLSPAISHETIPHPHFLSQGITDNARS